MKPYLPAKQFSPRPGCTCCNFKFLHGNTARKSAVDTQARRAGKKSKRQSDKREMRTQLDNDSRFDV